MDRWAPNREDVNNCLRRHPVFQFWFTFCLGFTAWSLLDLVFPSVSISYRSHDISAVVMAGFLASLILFLQRRRTKRQSESQRDATQVI